MLPSLAGTSSVTLGLAVVSLPIAAGSRAWALPGFSLLFCLAFFVLFGWLFKEYIVLYDRFMFFFFFVRVSVMNFFPYHLCRPAGEDL